MKAVALVNQDQVLKETCERIQARKNAMNERLKFIMKNLKDEQEKTRKEVEPEFELLTSRLKILGLLPDDYSARKHTLDFDIKTNLIRILTDDDIAKEKLAFLEEVLFGR